MAKLLSSRLKKILPNIIDERQSAFIEGRQLLHSVIVANEVVEEAKRGQKPCMLFKVDFERAYDAVSWSFLSYMMSRMGFCNKWICWIQACLKSASISVLVNGSPTAEFAPHRGLRQGDPLAPLLFNIVAEGLTGLIRKAVKEKLFSEFLVGKDSIPVSILQYADDTIFFGEPTMQNVKVIKSILRGFELVSGLKINFAKSHFGALGRPDQWVREAAGFLNCRILSFPFTYLGIPVGVTPRRGQLWDSVIRKCENKLARWKQRHLSYGGRVTLIHSTLSSIPIYFLSFFRLPEKVAEKLLQTTSP